MSKQFQRGLGLATIVGAILYIPLALYLDTLPPWRNPDPGIIYPPFKHLGGNSWQYLTRIPSAISDNNDAPNRSRLEMTEDGRPLGPAHSEHVSIVEKGNGRYSHWQSSLIFSTSDNSDPNTNGRAYRVFDPSAKDPFESLRAPHRPSLLSRLFPSRFDH
ncbi:hypothetical protein U7859_30335 [Bradyrhizobium ottawaense]|uniref:hypothetical protein n=1 Tax=Bradyrhizobium ottawaense TaxID=931866 RepID=UPI002AE05A98|nr:hypothetical protein [Bradyrhizobium ottawaense]WQN81257.1 hypothetical protein U7859_30335 [Bradyrhizobium ottawaense]